MPDRTEHRLPPQNLEAEMSVLGGILLENNALNRALETLRPEDFYRDAHRKIFSALITLSDRSEPADLVTLTAILKTQGTLEEVGGSSYLSTLVDYVPTAANIGYYCKIVKEKSISRELIRVATEIVGKGYEGGEVEASLDWAEGEIYKIAEMKSSQAFYSTKEIVKDTIKTIENLFGGVTLIADQPIRVPRTVKNWSCSFRISPARRWILRGRCGSSTWWKITSKGRPWSCACTTVSQTVSRSFKCSFR